MPPFRHLLVIWARFQASQGGPEPGILTKVAKVVIFAQSGDSDRFVTFAAFGSPSGLPGPDSGFPERLPGPDSS